MKKIAILLCLSVFAFAKDYKVVFDCSSANYGYVKSRMWLIGKTIDMFQKRGDRLIVALTLHGKCAMIASEDFDTFAEEKDHKNIASAQKYLQKLLKRKNFKAHVCAMSLDANEIDRESIIKGVFISPNSFLETIRYQNEGYAIMTFK